MNNNLYNLSLFATHVNIIIQFNMLRVNKRKEYFGRCNEDILRWNLVIVSMQIIYNLNLSGVDKLSFKFEWSGLCVYIYIYIFQKGILLPNSIEFKN